MTEEEYRVAKLREMMAQTYILRQLLRHFIDDGSVLNNIFDDYLDTINQYRAGKNDPKHWKKE